ncbi:MAG: YeiH family protein [Xanthobacteraceae bacterium]
MPLNKAAAQTGVVGVNLATIKSFAPGLLLAGVLAFVSTQLEPLGTKATLAVFGRPITITAPVIALLVGMAFHPVALRAEFKPGMSFAVKQLLRWAIALFGLKIALADIIGLGVGTAVMVVVAMAMTLVSAVLLARLLGRDELFGAIAGGATAVCGASAALATASVLPYYKGSESDTAFVVITVNILATIAMVLYPLVCVAAGFEERTTGIFLGATIHDVAQVVGAGYSLSDATGNIATVVKLFRVFMLLPVVLGIGWWFSARGGNLSQAKIPVPVFAIMFVVFALINSMGVLPPMLKSVMVEASRWGLLIAIAALGLNTSLTSVFRVGPRHLLVVLGSTLVIFVAPLAWLWAGR